MTAKKPGARYFRGPIEARLEYYSIRDPKSKCVVWWGATNCGYGCVGYQGKIRRTHDLTYELANGPVPEGFELHHRCKNKRCRNLDHLEVVTRGEHNRIEWRPKAYFAAMTHCKRGHEFTPQNTYITAKGRRSCRACHAAWQRTYTRRKLIEAATLRR
jgi:HNH endonuclease